MGSRGADAEPLSPADASNIYVDAPDQVNVFLLAGLLGRGGVVGPDGGVDMPGLRTHLAERVREGAGGSLRRLSQRVAGSGRHLWWEACPPDLDRHVRLVSPVDGQRGLAALCARLMTLPLLADRPLWELLVVPGAGPDGPGIVLRIHHAVADGTAAVALVGHLLAQPADAPPPVRLPREEGPAPHRRWRSAAVGAWRATSLLRGRIPATVLLGRRSPRRDVSFTTADLDTVHRCSRAAGVTVNDVLLAAVTAGVEAGLRAAREVVPARLPVSVPVALPDRRGSGNAVGVMLVPLPTGEPDRDRRLRMIAEVTRARRGEARAQGTFELTRTRWGSHLVARLARRQRFVALFVTNVHGPGRRLRLAGAPLLHAWPVTPLQGNVRACVSALSYAGGLAVTVHADAEALPVDVVAAALEEELDRLAGPSEPGP